MSGPGANLLDVNVLVALAWHGHSHHKLAHDWFGDHGSEAWASSPMTQAGLVRVITSPALRDAPYTMEHAMRTLTGMLSAPEHAFWPDDINLSEAVHPCAANVHGYRQLSDAYLLGLALRHRGKLVTFDRGIRHLLPRGSPLQASILTLE